MPPRKPTTHAPWHCARHTALDELRAALTATSRAPTADEARFVTESLAAFSADHTDVIAAVVAASEAVGRSSSPNLMLTMQLDGWIAAMRQSRSPPVGDPHLADALASLGAPGLRRAPDRAAVVRGIDALRSMVESVRIAASIVALPAFAAHLPGTDSALSSLPTYARVAYGEALAAHRGNADALGILTRARDRLRDSAGENPTRRARVAPFVVQFEAWIAAATPKKTKRG